MNCANNYCLYNKGFACTLDGVNIDYKGMCDECVLVKVDDDILECEKERQLNMIAEIQSKQ